MRFITLLLICFGGISSANAKSFLMSCLARLSATDIKLDASTCEIGRCYENAGKILDQLRTQPNYDARKARVLFISSFDTWGVHVVVEYCGKIYDVEYSNGRKDFDKKITGRPIAEFFKIHKWSPTKSKVLEAPADNWTASVSKQAMIEHDSLVSGWKEFDPEKFPGYRFLGTEDYLRNPRENK